MYLLILQPFVLIENIVIDLGTSYLHLTFCVYKIDVMRLVSFLVLMFSLRRILHMIIYLRLILNVFTPDLWFMWSLNMPSCHSTCV